MRHVLVVCALLFAGPASAALLEVDLLAPGDGLVTRDTGSGLDWLDATATQALTFREVEDGAGGWIDAGWRHATTAEVCGLLSELGSAPTPCPGTWYPTSAVGQPVLDLLGVTRTDDQDQGGGVTLHLEQLWALFDDGGGADPLAVGLVELSVDRYSTGLVRTYVDVAPDAQDEDRFHGFYGNFLVRSIPEPATLPLVGLGLVALATGASSRRRA